MVLGRFSLEGLGKSMNSLRGYGVYLKFEFLEGDFDSLHRFLGGKGL